MRGKSSVIGIFAPKFVIGVLIIHCFLEQSLGVFTLMWPKPTYLTRSVGQSGGRSVINSLMLVSEHLFNPSCLKECSYMYLCMHVMIKGVLDLI